MATIVYFEHAKVDALHLEYILYITRSNCPSGRIIGKGSILEGVEGK